MANKGGNSSLAVESRPQTGTTAANALRRAGKVPAVLFGHGVDPMAVALDAKAFDDLLHAGGKNRLLNITIDGEKKDTALVRDVQRDPITRRVLHADLQRVSESETVSASLPIVTVGVAEGVRNMGGVMDVVVHTLDVEGPANAIPPNIEIDVNELALHAHLTAGDIKLPPNFKLRIDPTTILISIEPSKTEQQMAEAAVAAAEPVEVPTVAETTPTEEEPAP
jgi:large subunit ribosomal protein L25